ncbi:MAG: hypothetical protein WA974_09620 [Thermodesulfobacteriota bacterium]
MDIAKNMAGPAHVVPAGKPLQLDTSLVPKWWTRFDLILRCKLAQNCGDLRVIIAPGTTGEKPIRCNQENALFRLQSNTGPPRAITLFNPTNQDVIITKYSLNNYSAINTGPPRLVVLLTPYAVPAFPVLTALFLALATSFSFLPALILFWNRGVRRITQWPLWIPLFFPWVVLILAGTLLIRNKHLLLSWETLLLFPFPGYLFLALTSRFFRERLFVPFLVALIIATFGVLISTVLGIGLPVKSFGPELVYQTHFTQTAHYAGLIYLILAIGLYWQKKDWFFPGRHLFLSSIWLVFLPLLIIYFANWHSGYGGDNTFNSLLPWRIIQGEGFFFSKAYVAAKGSWGLLEAGNAYLPTFPIGPGFLGLPTALIQYFFSSEPVHKLIAWNQKVTAVWIAALSAALIFQMVYLLGRKKWLSLLLTAAFALGTTQLTISAAVLWQHGPAVLLLCLGLFSLVKGQQKDPSFYPLSALPLAFLPLMRPQTGLFYLAGLASVAILQPRMILRFFLWSLPGITALLLVNLGLYHSFLGGYGYQASGNNFATPLLEGALGSLFSPNRGFLIFSPFLILGIIGGGILWTRRSIMAISFSLAALFFFLVHAKYAQWHGGYCVGPRFSSELVPILVLFSVTFFLEYKKSLARLAGWLLILISIAITLPGFFFMREQGQWNVFPDVDYYRQERVWDYRDWLPIHFRHYLNLVHYKVTPAYAFVITGSPEPLKSKEVHYRVKVTLDKEPSEIIRLTNVFLKKGAYRIVFKGDAENSIGARAELIIGFIGHKIEERSISIEKRPSLVLSHIIELEKPGSIDIRLKVSGQGTLVLDTVQIIPVD